MGSDISPEDRKRMERFIAEHPPYEDDDPEVNYFDHPNHDPQRGLSRLFKLLLDGKLESKKK